MRDVERAQRAERISALKYDFASKAKMRHRSCNLCGCELLVTLTHRDRYGFDASAQGCSRCGLVFLNPVMTAGEYAEFYTSVYRPLVSAFHGRLIDSQTIQGEQRDYAGSLVRLLEPHIANRGCKTLLDVGGSTGIVAHRLMSSFGLRGTVIDPAPLEIEVARKLGLETVTGTVEEFDAGGMAFDVIVMCQTVDHLLDVRSSLEKIRALIAPQGCFFVDIVDLRAGYLRNGCIEDAIKIDHPYYLTEPTMIAYLDRAGFEIAGINYAADHLHVGFVCLPGRQKPEALPSQSDVREMFREIRAVQNMRR